MKKQLNPNDYISVFLKDHADDYLKVSFPKTVLFPVGTRKICTWCGAKRLISKMRPYPIVFDSHIEWECNHDCLDTYTAPSAEVQS